MSEKQIRMAAQLYEIRSTLVRVCGLGRFLQIVPFYQDLIRDEMEKTSGSNEIATAIRMAKAEKDSRVMWLLAAAVQMVEPMEVS
jgi:hypothetical protein